MSVYYCVTITYRTNGTVTANITNAVSQDEKPQDTRIHLTDRDVYCDWIKGYDAAIAHADNATKKEAGEQS